MSENNGDKLSVYRVTGRYSGRVHHAAARSPQEACQTLGMAIVDCFVVSLKATKYTRPDGVKGLMVQVPCLVCPYQFAECQNPPGAACPYRNNTPDFQAWLKVVAEAHLCNHVGQPIFKKDYENGLMWLTEGAAVLYISRRAS